MKMEHVIVVHLVDVISAQYENTLGPFPLQDINVLVDAICGSPIPPVDMPLLRGHAFNEFAEFVIENTPSQANMSVQRERPVLSEHINVPYIGVEAV
jgi:hypothetical protein